MVGRILGVPARKWAPKIAPLISKNPTGTLIDPCQPNRLIVRYSRCKASDEMKVETKLIIP